MTPPDDCVATLQAKAIESDLLAKNFSDSSLDARSDLAALRCIVQALVVTHPNRDGLLAAFMHETDVARTQEADIALEKLRNIEEACKQIGQWITGR